MLLFLIFKEFTLFLVFYKIILFIEIIYVDCYSSNKQSSLD